MTLINNLALPVALILVGVIMLAKALYAVHEVYSSQGWPSVSGEVVKHHDDLSLSSGSARTHRAFYTYNVNGQTYDGNVTFIASRMTSKNEVDEFWSRYVIGIPVTVFYNPNKPQESLLIREQDTNWFFLAFSLVVLGAGVWFLARLFLEVLR